MNVEIDHVGVVIAQTYQDVSIFLVGLPFVAFSTVVKEDNAVDFALKHFPQAQITLLDMTKPNPQVVIMKEAT